MLTAALLLAIIYKLKFHTDLVPYFGELLKSASVTFLNLSVYHYDGKDKQKPLNHLLGEGKIIYVNRI